jgi:hypothetical protein
MAVDEKPEIGVGFGLKRVEQRLLVTFECSVRINIRK